MKITTIRFRRLQSHAVGYGHDAVEAEAAVEAGETPEETMAALKAWVLTELASEARLRSLERNASHLETEVARLKNERDDIVSDIERGRKVLREHDKLADLARRNGMGEQADLLGDGMPF